MTGLEGMPLKDKMWPHDVVRIVYSFLTRADIIQTAILYTTPPPHESKILDGRLVKREARMGRTRPLYDVVVP